ncbi:MAG: sugar phosphate isomerase/epimerase [Oscillospiraceae bacterium]|nr:sugar phosphate isomerase/epimerase [Oscillospiraceae bacterium]
MRVAYTGWTWLINHKDNYKWEFEQFLKEAADIGYDSVENFAFIMGYFDDDAGEVAGLLEKYGLHMANLYQHFSDDSGADYEKAVAYVDFMKKIKADYLNLQGTMWNDDPQDRPLNKERVLAYAEVSNKIGKLCADNGIKACMHPHANTAIFTEEDIDFYAANTDPNCVYLCMDTAHTLLGGMDPVGAFAKYADRIGYVHLKDVSPVEAVPGRRMSRFVPLGMGVVDFLGVYNTLKAGGFDGVLCVELDRPHVCNYKSALISRQYIHNVLGL